jgi:CBS domain-containing protein
MPAGEARRIEKGWTVYDAVQHPVGNVSDVFPERSVMVIDGRPEGYDSFELPLSAVERTTDNEVHLRQRVDVASTPAGGSPRFVEVTTARVATGGVTSTTTTTFTTPRVAQASSPRASTPPPVWIDQSDEEDEGWPIAKLAAAGVALGGVALATYLLRQRRQKSAWERFLDASSGYTDTAADLAKQARQQNPAWLAGLAAAALPLAYYAWPSSRPTYRDQAHTQLDDLAGYLEASFGDLSGWLPTMPWQQPSATERLRRNVGSSAAAARNSDWMSPSAWELPFATRRKSEWSEWSDWSMRPDVIVPAALLAASALAFTMARRKSGRTSIGARIGDVMTRQPRVIQPDATVTDAAALMRQLNVGALPVCDGTRLIGMLTDRDITLRSTADGRDPHLTTVRDIMSSGVAWASEDDPVEQAARIMREHRIRRLPIVNDRHSLVGVVSLGDLAVDVDDDDVSGDTLEEVSRPSRPNR